MALFTIIIDDDKYNLIFIMLCNFTFLYDIGLFFMSHKTQSN